MQVPAAAGAADAQQLKGGRPLPTQMHGKIMCWATILYICRRRCRALRLLELLTRTSWWVDKAHVLSHLFLCAGGGAAMPGPAAAGAADAQQLEGE